jgi:dTMP kinase
MSPQTGLFLAFEGVEGSGKSTQVQLLAERLRARGRQVVVAREPGSTPLGERIRSLVLDQHELGIPARSELFLMLAARAAFVDLVVGPALARGDIVIADRFELSTLAYQGAGRGLPVADIVHSNSIATAGTMPDATILLELDPEEGARRQLAAAKNRDRLELESSGFHRRVADGYLALAGSVANVRRVDARGTVDEVSLRVLEVLSSTFPETFHTTGFIT